MYNTSTVLNAFLGDDPLVGWRQNPNPDGTPLLDMLSSTSGVYFDGQHPTITIENLASVAPDFKKMVYPAWSNTVNYSIGQTVAYSGQIFRAKTANINQAPAVGNDWELYNGFTDWLKKETQDGILFALNMWIEKKIQRKSAANLLKYDKVIKGSGRPNDIKTSSGSSGFEIVPVRNLGIVTKIEKVALQFENNASIEIKVFQSGLLDPIYSESFNYTGNGSVQWFIPGQDWELNDPGSYYLIYEGSLNYIEGMYDYNRHSPGHPRLSCGDSFLHVNPFSTQESTAQLWDPNQNQYTYTSNFGLNLQLSVRCDYTEFIVDQKTLFRDIVARGVAYRLLNKIAWRPEARTNRNVNNFDRQELLYERDGDSRGRKGGLKEMFMSSIEALSIDYTGINKKCLPCRTTGVTIKAQR